jgi:ribosome biogenesis GTPase / thiamine phosphate phosphatase
MIEFDFERLRALGLTPAVAAAATTSDHPPDAAAASALQLMRLTEVHRESVRLHDGAQTHIARASPRLARALDDAQTALAVGDWVLATHDAPGVVSVHTLVPRLSHIARRDADGRRHPVASHVDTALLVMGLDDDFNPRRLERYLALVHSSGVLPVVVLTKADVVTPEAVEARLAALRTRVSAALDVLAVNATAPAAATALAPYTALGQTLVLLGSSGAGKSTLTNTLLGTTMQDTGAVREHDGRGKHTTTTRSLFCLPGGACVIDTPGLRALRPDVDEATLSASYADVEALAMQCRFRDCRHHDEPGCAVRAGIDADRLKNFQKLLREARRDTQSVFDRQRQVAVWKARSKASRARLKDRGGGGGA